MSKGWTWAQDRQRATSATHETWRNPLFKRDENVIGLLLEVRTANKHEVYGTLSITGHLDGEIKIGLKDVNDAFR